MGKEPDYVVQLRILYNTYTGKELEQAIGVTTRSIQNYLKEENRTTPSNDVVSNIREAYAKHANGEPIKKESAPLEGADYKDKYIALLERNLKVEQEVSEVRKSLEQSSIDNLALATKILEGQAEIREMLLEHIAHNIAALPDAKQGGKNKNHTAGNSGSVA